MPPLTGRALQVSFTPELTAWRGRLLSADPRGKPVHAGSMLRKRTIVLDRELLDQPAEMARILIHELFHFVWPRLGNPLRRSWEALLASETSRRARGELGWSAEERKLALSRKDAAERTRLWREYACESFCDSAAYVFCRRKHSEHTLARRFREARAEWFRASLRNRDNRI